MPFQTTCSCGRRLELAEEHIGKQVRCPACKTVFTAEVPPSAGSEPMNVLPSTCPETFATSPTHYPAAMGAGPTLESPRLEDAREDDIHEAQPPSSRVPSGQWRATRVLDRIAFLAVIFAGVFMYEAFKDLRLAQASREVPQTMTLADLVKNGPGDNAHVILTDFIPGQNYVYLYEKSSTKSWKEVWIPLLPLDEKLQEQIVNNPVPNNPALRPTSVQVVIKLQSVRDSNGVEKWAEKMVGDAKVQGMVVNLIESLDSKTSNILRESYPSTDFDKCWLVHENRKPAGRSSLMGFLGGGAVALLLAGAWGLVRFLYRNG